ncbi:MAG: complex I NDUFA9 subunit family protein [Burkholderiaceae bacterium]
MNCRRILVTGGTGFIGRHLAARLVASGREVILPTRRRARARDLLLLPTVDVVEADLADDATLTRLTARADAVVNLVGILHGSRADPWGPEFERLHVRLPARLAAACEAAGVRRLLHVSALGVHDGGERDLPSMYLRSKAAGERALRDAAPTTAWTIFRPAVVYGPDDHLLTLFGRLQTWLPLLPLARAETRMQPIFVGDVAQALDRALDTPATHRRVYELAGSEVCTLRQLAALAGRLVGHRRPIVALPDWLGRLQATLLEFAPGPTLMSRDNFDSLSIDNVAHGPIAAELGIAPGGPSALAAALIGRDERLGDWRMRAGR